MELFIISSKVENIIKTMYTENIEEFYFKISVPDGYRLKTTEPSSIDGTYLTTEETVVLLDKLHIKTETIIHKVFKIDIVKELQIKRLTSYIHELGIIKANFSSVNATKEDLVNVANHLRQVTKDVELAELDVNELQKEELFNILHEKHYEYLANFTSTILAEVLS